MNTKFQYLMTTINQNRPAAEQKKPILKLSLEAWDDLSAAARADLQKKYDIKVNPFYYVQEVV